MRFLAPRVLLPSSAHLAKVAAQRVAPAGLEEGNLPSVRALEVDRARGKGRIQTPMGSWLAAKADRPPLSLLSLSWASCSLSVRVSSVFVCTFTCLCCHAGLYLLCRRPCSNLKERCFMWKEMRKSSGSDGNTDIAMEQTSPSPLTQPMPR